MKQTSIAVMLTCYNRKQKTLDCLESLSNQTLLEGIKLSIYLVDDGSTDNTSEAVRQAYPQVNVLQGDGNLFWTGGMQLAFSTAIRDRHDFYVWLNDDTMLYPTALKTLLETFDQVAQSTRHTIVVGSTQDPETQALTYGGLLKGRWYHPCQFGWVQPSNQPQPCDTMNGNCVLIPHQVVELVGGLDTVFRHYAADYDYGLRAKQKGCTLWITPGYIGTCDYNDPKSRKQTTKSELSDQMKKLGQPKGIATDVILHPFWEWKAFTERHAGLFWPIYWLLPYRRMIWMTSFGKRKQVSA